jgi:hypothetical protein
LRRESKNVSQPSQCIPVHRGCTEPKSATSKEKPNCAQTVKRRNKCFHKNKNKKTNEEDEEEKDGKVWK